MSDEMKNNGQNEAKDETVADKLNSAAQTLNEANAEAKVRKEEEKKLPCGCPGMNIKTFARNGEGEQRSVGSA